MGFAQISWNLPYGRRKLRKTSARRQSDKGYATSHHLRWDPLLPYDVGSIAQNIREDKEERRQAVSKCTEESHGLRSKKAIS